MIEIEAIQKKYHKKRVLCGCSFSAHAGECVGIVGANGCGKTTLLSIMAGVQNKDGGLIRYYGHEALKKNKVFQKYVGYVPQDNPLISELTVEDNLKLWCEDLSDKNKMESIMQELRLKEYRKVIVAKLSGGTKRRLSLACALINRPPILLMDEPCAAVDLACKAQIHAYLKQFKADKGIIVLSTHDESELALCDTVYYMNEGVLKRIEKGTDIEKMILNDYKSNDR